LRIMLAASFQEEGTVSMFLKRLQLGLLHVAVAISLVPITSTLNRVMIKELAIPATLVALFAVFPYLFSPVQVGIGALSDRHPIFGFRRTPYIAVGALFCVGGMVISPFGAYVMAEGSVWGALVSVLAFFLWGMGFNFASVSYLSLATEISGEDGRSRTVSVMWFMMITGIILTAILLSRLLVDYSPAKLERSFQLVGAIALVFTVLGLIRLEPRMPRMTAGPGDSRTENRKERSIGNLVRLLGSNRQAGRFFLYLTILLTAILGQEILLEPFGGEAFDMPVSETTEISSIWGTFVLVLLLAGGLMERRVAKRTVARIGGILAAAGFVFITASGLARSTSIFYLGLCLLGSGTGLSTVSNLSLMLDMTIAGRVGMFMGVWGISEAAARIIGSLLGGSVRDLFGRAFGAPVLGYVVVFGIMAGLVVVSLFLLETIDVGSFRTHAGTASRAAS
jgi:MFS transporter, BCD family, chlorophyll transporter